MCIELQGSVATSLKTPMSDRSPCWWTACQSWPQISRLPSRGNVYLAGANKKSLEGRYLVEDSDRLSVHMPTLQAALQKSALLALPFPFNATVYIHPIIYDIYSKQRAETLQTPPSSTSHHRLEKSREMPQHMAKTGAHQHQQHHQRHRQKQQPSRLPS